MNKIKWIKMSRFNKRKPNSSYGQFPYYQAKAGCVILRCWPEIKYPRQIGTKAYLIGWKCYIHFHCRQIIGKKVYKSLELSQKSAEKLAIEHLLGSLSTALDAFGVMGLKKRYYL